MQYVADLHLHSKFSRAVSPMMTLPVMAEYARFKGLDILTTSDFTHPLWFKEINTQLEEAADGLYKLKDQKSLPRRQAGNLKNTDQNSKTNKEVLFLLSTEIASIYKQRDKLRRIHNLVFAPSMEVAVKISEELVRRGCNLSSDGRPIIGLSSKNLLELILGIDENCFLIPCHVWTPHFGLFGSASGFDSIDEAFGDYAKYIYGIETGLSSDPNMNWSIKDLSNRSILSFSDAHSPSKMGREATVFELEGDIPTYSKIKQAIMKHAQSSVASRESEYEEKQSDNRILYTIEFYPEEGKYHYSGHRSCKISFDPLQIIEKGVICTVCHKKLTEGVLVRVKQLSDATISNRVREKISPRGLKWYTDIHKSHLPYVKLVPLLEIVAQSMHSTPVSQKVKDQYVKLCSELGSEFEVLLQSNFADISRIGGDRIARGIQKVRAGNIIIKPGYDGEYGKVSIWNKGEEENKKESQLVLDF